MDIEDTGHVPNKLLTVIGRFKTPGDFSLYAIEDTGRSEQRDMNFAIESHFGGKCAERSRMTCVNGSAEMFMDIPGQNLPHGSTAAMTR